MVNEGVRGRQTWRDERVAWRGRLLQPDEDLQTQVFSMCLIDWNEFSDILRASHFNVTLTFSLPRRPRALAWRRDQYQTPPLLPPPPPPPPPLLPLPPPPPVGRCLAPRPKFGQAAMRAKNCFMGRCCPGSGRRGRSRAGEGTLGASKWSGRVYRHRVKENIELKWEKETSPEKYLFTFQLSENKQLTILWTRLSRNNSFHSAGTWQGCNAFICFEFYFRKEKNIRRWTFLRTFGLLLFLYLKYLEKLRQLFHITTRSFLYLSLFTSLYYFFLWSVFEEKMFYTYFYCQAHGRLG